MQKETQSTSNLSELTQPGRGEIKRGMYISFTLQSISLTTLYWFTIRPNGIVIPIQPLIHGHGIPRFFRLHTPLRFLPGNLGSSLWFWRIQKTHKSLQSRCKYIHTYSRVTNRIFYLLLERFVV